MNTLDVELTDELKNLINITDDASEKFLNSKKACKIVLQMYDEKLIKSFEDFNLIIHANFHERIEEYVKLLSTIYQGEYLEKEVKEVAQKLIMKDSAWQELLKRVCAEFFNRLNMTQFK